MALCMTCWSSNSTLLSRVFKEFTEYLLSVLPGTDSDSIEGSHVYLPKHEPKSHIRN